jgi:hypothetical protein
MSAPGAEASGFHVDPDDIGARATALDWLATGLHQIAGKSYAVHPWAYGLVGQLFASSAQTAAADALVAITDLATATVDAARTLRTVQASYLDVEGVMTARFRELGL